MKNLLFLLLIVGSATILLGQEPTKKAPSKTSSLEHNIYIGYGYNYQTISANSITRPFLNAENWIKSISLIPVPQLEITFSKWFEKRNYLGVTYRTGKQGYEVTLADNPQFAFHNPAISQHPTFSYSEWHLHFFGAFWQFEITPEIFLTTNREHNWIYQLSSLAEIGVNFITPSWDTRSPLSWNDEPYADLRMEYVRNTQIRGGLRLRNAIIKGRYSVAIDFGWNGGMREFHFMDILPLGALDTAIPLVEIRNNGHYFFGNISLGYWF